MLQLAWQISEKRNGMIIYSQPVKQINIFTYTSHVQKIYKLCSAKGGDLSLIELCSLYFLIMLVKSKYNLIQGGGGGVPKSSQPDQEAINKIDK